MNVNCMYLMEWVLFLFVKTVFQTLLFILHSLKLNWRGCIKNELFFLKNGCKYNAHNEL